MTHDVVGCKTRWALGTIHAISVPIEHISDLGKPRIERGGCVSRRGPEFPSALQLLKYRSLVGLVAVQLNAGVAYTSHVESSFHDLERGHLLGYEQHSLAVC